MISRVLSETEIHDMLMSALILKSLQNALFQIVARSLIRISTVNPGTKKQDVHMFSLLLRFFQNALFPLCYKVVNK